MTADFDLNMTVHGTPEELFSLIDLMKRYSDGEKGIYFSMLRLTVESNSDCFKSTDDDKLRDLIAAGTTSIVITASGPYGHYGTLSDIEFFEDMSSAAPGASFEGVIAGGTSYTEEHMIGELKDGILDLTTFIMSNDEIPDAYLKYFTDTLPYERFVELFKVNTEDFDSDDYEEFVTCELASADDALNMLDYESFLEMLGTDCDLDEDEYEEIVNQFTILDYDTFCDTVNDTDDFGDTITLRYDPVAKKYLDGKTPPMKTNTAYDATDQIRQYLRENGLPCSDEDINAISVEDAYSIMFGTYGKEDSAQEAADTSSSETDISVINEEQPATETDAPVIEDETTVDTTDAPASPTKKHSRWLVWLLIVLMLIGGAAAAYFYFDAVASAVNNFIAHIMHNIL